MRYLSLYFHFFRVSLMAALEYRFNLLVWTFLNLFWTLLSFVGIELLFGQVSSIAGWPKQEIFLLLIIWTIFHDFLSIFIRPSLRQISHLIRHGKFDFLLLKPVSLRFLSSVQDFGIDSVSRFCLTSVILVFFLRQMGIEPSLLLWLDFTLLFLSGAIIFYSFFFALAGLNFWFINLFNLDDLHSRLIDAGRFPIDIFRGRAKTFFTYLLPIAFIAFFPAQILLGRIGSEWVVYGAVMASVFFIASQLFWSLALRSYSSASS
ncbi:MAG: ABC-2 family transporter protein [Candidatus Nealsonbacteria bacterium]|nr:ABC-2 family transporter protein [Candidatus Nealsonbacteria bacterium]